jgi:hypothetical protein
LEAVIAVLMTIEGWEAALKQKNRHCHRKNKMEIN